MATISADVVKLFTITTLYEWFVFAIANILAAIFLSLFFLLTGLVPFGGLGMVLHLISTISIPITYLVYLYRLSIIIKDLGISSNMKRKTLVLKGSAFSTMREICLRKTLDSGSSGPFDCC
jgi:hypothetical protein